MWYMVGRVFKFPFLRKFFFESLVNWASLVVQKEFLYQTFFKKDNNGSRMRRRATTFTTTATTTKLSYGLLSLWRKRSGFPFLHPQRSSFVPIKHGHFKGFTVCRDRPIQILKILFKKQSSLWFQRSRSDKNVHCWCTFGRVLLLLLYVCLWPFYSLAFVVRGRKGMWFHSS